MTTVVDRDVKPSSMTKLAADLRDAEEAARLAADAVSDGGSCCSDFVVLRISRTRGLTAALESSGVEWRRRHKRGRQIAIHPRSGGMASKLTTACEAMARVLRERGWDASVYYLVD